MSGILKERKEKKFTSYTLKKSFNILEKDLIPLTIDQNVYNIAANEIGLSNDDEILVDNIKWIIRKILKQKPIEIHSNNTHLTSKGVNRIKRVTRKTNHPKKS